MTEPDKDRLTEVELELEQRKRLMDAFMVVQTYDNREAALVTLARHIDSYGDKYWPIFERLEGELEDRKSREKRLRSRLG